MNIKDNPYIQWLAGTLIIAAFFFGIGYLLAAFISFDPEIHDWGIARAWMCVVLFFGGIIQGVCMDEGA